MMDRISSPMLRLLTIPTAALVLFGLFGPFQFLQADQPKAPSVDPDHAAKMTKGTELFAQSIRKTLVDRCVKCHGGEKTRSGLDLVTREGLLKGGDHGPAVIPGKAKESLLYKLVAHLEDPHMPSKEAKLPERDIRALTQWIDLGAPYDKPLLSKAGASAKKPMVVTDEDRRFWSFRPLQKTMPPVVHDTAWCRTPIDAFILAELEDKKLAPNAEIDKRRLVRRVYLDVMGLPPTPEEVEAFVNDSSPEAYEKLIDRLLASPHYGERWARHWLDLARFAESHGYEQDYDRPHAYTYRDFVIKAFNLDLPYDKFVAWQIAGDEIEPDNPLALMATGYLAAGVHSTQITKNQVEKERYDELDDMARTIGTSMLGVTIGCARCHDHKFDPIPTSDYYRFLSTFTTTVRSDYDINLDPKGFAAATAQYQAEHGKLREALAYFEKEKLPGRLDAWLAAGGHKNKSATPWKMFEFTAVKSSGGATFTALEDGSWIASGKNPDVDTYTLSTTVPDHGITAIRLEALADPSFVKGGPGRASNGNFALSNFTVTAKSAKGDAKPLAVKLVHPRATFEQKGLPVAAAIDSDPKSAWAIDPLFGKNHAAVFDVEGAGSLETGANLTFTLDFRTNTSHSIGRPRISFYTGPLPAPLDGDAIPASAAAALAAFDEDPKTPLGPDQKKALLHWYKNQDAQWKKLAKAVTDHEKSAPRPQLLKALICSEGVPAIRNHTQGGDFLEQTHFLRRGDPNQKIAVASPAYLQVLMRNPDQENHWHLDPPKGWRTSYRRRSLANWITDTDAGAGALLSRVVVNRLWQHHMGKGIVATPSDFGYQGEKPTHPELLEWLAQQLIDGGWRLKPIHKMILLSAVYRQSSESDPEKLKLDPDNRLWWRHPRQRLEAEVIRDSLLKVSGVLDPTMFGPGTLDLAMKRRSIYFFVKRSQLIPPLMLFDAPDTLQSLEQRVSTVIAPQALLLINNAVVRTYAEAFAGRIRPAAEGQWDEAVRKGFALALGRPPHNQELQQSVDFLKQQRNAYEADGKKDGVTLALADFCQVLMGLNEFIYVD